MYIYVISLYSKCDINMKIGFSIAVTYVAKWYTSTHAIIDINNVYLACRRIGMCNVSICLCVCVCHVPFMHAKLGTMMHLMLAERINQTNLNSNLIKTIGNAFQWKWDILYYNNMVCQCVTQTNSLYLQCAMWKLPTNNCRTNVEAFADVEWKCTHFVCLCEFIWIENTNAHHHYMFLCI